MAEEYSSLGEDSELFHDSSGAMEASSDDETKMDTREELHQHHHQTDKEFGIAYREGAIPHYRYICAGCKKDDFLSAQSMAGHAAACPEYQAQKVNKSNRPKNHKIKVTKEWWQGHLQRMSEAGLNAFHPSTAYSRASKRQRKQSSSQSTLAPNPKKRKISSPGNADMPPLPIQEEEEDEDEEVSPVQSPRISQEAPPPAKRLRVVKESPVKKFIHHEPDALQPTPEEIDTGFVSATGRMRRRVTLNVDYREPEDYTPSVSDVVTTTAQTKKRTCPCGKSFPSVPAYARHCRDCDAYLSQKIDQPPLMDGEDMETEVSSSENRAYSESPTRSSPYTSELEYSPGATHPGSYSYTSEDLSSSESSNTGSALSPSYSTTTSASPSPVPSFGSQKTPELVHSPSNLEYSKARSESSKTRAKTMEDVSSRGAVSPVQSVAQSPRLMYDFFSPNPQPQTVSSPEKKPKTKRKSTKQKQSKAATPKWQIQQQMVPDSSPRVPERATSERKKQPKAKKNQQRITNVQMNGAAPQEQKKLRNVKTSEIEKLVTPEAHQQYSSDFVPWRQVEGTQQEFVGSDPALYPGHSSARQRPIPSAHPPLSTQPGSRHPPGNSHFTQSNSISQLLSPTKTPLKNNSTKADDDLLSVAAGLLGLAQTQQNEVGNTAHHCADTPKQQRPAPFSPPGREHYSAIGSFSNFKQKPTSNRRVNQPQTTVQSFVQQVTVDPADSSLVNYQLRHNYSNGSYPQHSTTFVDHGHLPNHRIDQSLSKRAEQGTNHSKQDSRNLARPNYLGYPAPNSGGSASVSSLLRSSESPSKHMPFAFPNKSRGMNDEHSVITSSWPKSDSESLPPGRLPAPHSVSVL